MIGIAFSTYFNEGTPEERLSIFKKCIDSLLSTDFDGYICIVDDCSTVEKHLDLYRNNTRVNIYKRPYNGGIAKTKNTGLRILLEQGCDVMFLSDDDVYFVDSFWDKIYIEAIEKTGVPHFSYFIGNNYGKVFYKGYPIAHTPHVNGCFLVVTKKLIEEVGYFKILLHKYGHEHSNFTIRCLKMGKIPYYCDALSSREHIKLVAESVTFKSIMDTTQMLKENEHIAMTVFTKEPLEE